MVGMLHPLAELDHELSLAGTTDLGTTLTTRASADSRQHRLIDVDIAEQGENHAESGQQEIRRIGTQHRRR